MKTPRQFRMRFVAKEVPIINGSVGTKRGKAMKRTKTVRAWAVIGETKDNIFFTFDSVWKKNPSYAIFPDKLLAEEFASVATFSDYNQGCVVPCTISYQLPRKGKKGKP